MSEVEIDEDALFENAVSDETTDTPVVTEQAEQTEQTAETEQAETTATTEAETERTAADESAGRVPAFRLREEAEARRRLENDLAQERAERAALKQRLEALERPAPKVEQEKPTKPDPLLDPEGYAKAVREEIREEIIADRRESSLLAAHGKYKDEFVEAYSAAQKAVDPALRARMQNSRDPGETLMEWHRENKTKAEIGNDLAAYKQRLREEALKDPEFRKAAIEAWRNEGQPQQPNGRPRVELPPSLNGASRSNAQLRSAMNADVDDDSLWNETTA
jgi:hypothetical protein